MSHLLELPPKLFDNVLQHVIRDNGTEKAWKLRGICSKLLSVYGVLRYLLILNRNLPILRLEDHTASSPG